MQTSQNYYLMVNCTGNCFYQTHVCSKIQHETPEEGQRIHQPKHCEYNNNNNNNNNDSSNTLNDKNHQASFQKLRQIGNCFIL